MAPYDSDSSGGEDNDYTETNVLLGYASKEASDDTISQIGGKPTWFNPTTPPSSAFAKCKVCNDLMVLLLQLNGDLPEFFPSHERRLYVFTCKKKTCRRKEGSVRALRGVRITEPSTTEKSKENKKPEPQVSKPAINLGETLFGTPSSSSTSANPFAMNGGSSNANPFSTSSSATLQNPFAAAGLPTSELAAKPAQTPSSPTADLPKTFASALSLNNTQKTFGPPPPPEPWPQDSDLPPAYPRYYLAEADYETLDKIEEVTVPTQTMEIDDGGSGGKEDKDVYESTIDKTFQKFADRLAQNPEQAIRYEFKGHPLLYSKNDAVGKLFSSGGKGNEKIKVESGSGNRIPRCSNCGAGRVFEVQLTPHAILELEREERDLDGMEWGTVLVGVCESDCQQKGVEGREVGYVEEWAGVQWEELK